MSLYALASGVLTADPQRRQGPKATFATGWLRAQDGEDSQFVSLIAFGGRADELLEHAAGDAIAVSGRAKLTAWTGRDGVARHGISITADQIAAAKPRPKPCAQRQSARARKGSAFRPARASGPPLPDDRVDDLWGTVP
jgi:single-stranded DNA-binding protein